MDAFEHLVEETDFQRTNLESQILDTVEQKAATPEISNYVASVRGRLKSHRPVQVEILKELRRDFQPGRDRLFYFYQTNATAWQEGWLIMDDQRTRKIYPLASGE